MKYLAPVLALLFVVPSSQALAATQSITLTLDEPQLGGSTQSQPTRQAVETPRSDLTSRSGPVNRKPDSASTIGRVGVVTAPRISIYRSRSSSRVLATCAQGTPLGIVGEQGQWYGVLMIDMSTGWVRKSSVKLLDYDLIATRKTNSGGPLGQQVVQSAMKYTGVPYVWGGNSWGGIDCSGFVKTVYGECGISLPRVSRDQVNVGYAVTWDDLQPGDRLYFACKGGQVDHAGIYMGNGYFIHSSSRRGGVAVDNLTGGFFARTLVAARRSG
ncbi:MAG: C40 family peptidase [Armatimonadota bacterium]|nr:C40 family peptidase [Armatimonadota bacterium]